MARPWPPGGISSSRWPGPATVTLGPVTTVARAVTLRLALAVSVVFGPVACSNDDDASDKDAAVEGTAPTTAVADDKEPVETDRPLPRNRQLDLEQRHANGVVLRITRVSFGPNSTTVSIEAFNGFRADVELNRRDAAMVDDRDQLYRFSPPPDNPELRVRPNETLRGELAFVGTPSRQAASFRLVFNGINPRTDKGTDDFALSSAPTFVFDGIAIER